MSDSTTPSVKLNRKVNPYLAVIASLLMGGSGYVYMDKSAEEKARWLLETPVLANSTQGRTRSGVPVESWVTESERHLYLCFMQPEVGVITCVKESKGKTF